MDRLLLNAKGTLALLELVSSTEPTSDNIWNDHAMRLRAAINKLQNELKGAPCSTDI